jgi:uncharacterized membrane protein HdeD (DUF308 family)
MSAQMSSVPDSGAPPTDKWWLLAILGLLSIATGFLALLWPGPTLLLIGIWFGVLLIMVGAGDLATAFAPGSSTPRRLVAAILGVITIFAGTMLLFRPGASVLTAAWVLGFWFVVTGILQLVQGLSHHESRLWNLLFGLIGIAAGAIILGSPRIGLQTLVLIAGLGFVMRGTVASTLAFSFRGIDRKHQTTTTGTAVPA